MQVARPEIASVMGIMDVGLVMVGGCSVSLDQGLGSVGSEGIELDWFNRGLGGCGWTLGLLGLSHSLLSLAGLILLLLSCFWSMVVRHSLYDLFRALLLHVQGRKDLLNHGYRQ